MAFHHESQENFSHPSSSFNEAAVAARCALSDEFCQHVISEGAGMVRVAQRDEPVVIHLPAPEPAPEVYRGVKEGKPFVVTIEPWDPQAQK